MGQLVVVKVGSTFPWLSAQQGDFEDWVLSGMGVQPHRATVLDVRNGATLPDYDGVAGVVIPGSHAMVTAHEDWSERVAAWLPGLVERGIPLLGICYGHQLLAYAMGGDVGDNPQGLEFGTLELQLNENAQQDPLLRGLAPSFSAHLCHAQSVLRLPIGAKRLASSAKDHNQAFVIDEIAWGVQFHPEFDADVVRTYIDQFQQPLLEDGQNPERLATGCVNTPVGARILRRFRALVVGRTCSRS